MTAVLEATRTIRLVTYSPEYRGQVLDLAKLMHAESTTYRDVPFAEAKLADQFQASILMPDLVYLRLAVRGDEVIGAMFGCIGEMMFSHEKACWDEGWFVKPEYRGGRAGIMLVKDWERWGLESGVRKFNLSQTAAVNVEATTKLMQHLGYRVIGYNAIKEF